MKLFLAALMVSVSAQAAALDAPALFARIKSLEGRWHGKSTKGWEDTNRIQVIAGGSVVMFTNFDAHPGETMVTMFHLDGDRLLLTHYCVAKNQPRLVATSYDEATSTVTFEYLDGTGLPSRDKGHMDKMVMTFIDAKRYVSRWTWYQNGQERWLEEIQRTRVE